jgi:hypothetical protein
MQRIGILLTILAALTALMPAASAARAPSRHACCYVAAGTVVKVELAQKVSSAVQKKGDAFALRLAAPLIVDGQVVLRAGTTGVGQVIESAPPGIGGKPAEMVLAASYLTSRRGPVRLDALQLARAGADNSTASHILGLSGIAFAPLGLVGIVVQGGQVEFGPGTVADAKVARAITLPPLARASRRDLAAAAVKTTDAAVADAGAILIPPPPAGQGQVVFFRAKSLLGTGQWFHVREAGRALGKLTNGAYFIQVTPPGIHTYTAVLEPELKDKLTLEVDPGETYFVSGDITGGLVLGAANLTPSDRAAFERAAKDLKPSAALDDAKPAEPPAAAAPASTPPAPVFAPPAPIQPAPTQPAIGPAAGDPPPPPQRRP